MPTENVLIDTSAEAEIDNFSEKSRVELLALSQGVSPVTDFDSLLGDFWPEDESADDFLAARRRWHSEGNEMRLQ